ncbi:MAG TPA: sulfite exporter TauE/SafE family protein [Rudaea sp.]|nr:sulfite exporter TauE/SafE family protein [Rudaea sp.]
MTDGLTLFSAFLLGLIASGHCLLMCGGISGALAVATRADARGRPRLMLLASYQIGRIASYALAGASLAGVGGSILRFVDQEQVRIGLRWVSAAMFALVGISLLLRGRGFDLAIGRRAWSRIAPLARRLLPVQHTWQALALGALWGWMPCGLAYSVLLIAWLSMSALHGAAIMLLFGLGTAPAVIAGAYAAKSGTTLLGRSGIRSAAAAALLVLALLTAGGPWLAAVSGIHSMGWLPFDCSTH